MKFLKILIFGMLFFAYTAAISATNINGRFVVMGTNNGKLEVLLQINTNTGSDDMGGATVVIGFNRFALNYSNNPQVNTNYIYYNFNNGNYSPATVTRPAIDKLWLNIDLPFNNSNNGTVVSGTNGWTDVATLFFDIINPADTLKLSWLTTNPYWGIYDANNTTMWSPGTLQNLSYVINNDVTPPEIVSASLLDSAKLEILFSEPMENSSALNISNYSINNGVSVLSGYLSTNQNKITLNTTSHTAGQQYTVSVNNVSDLAGNNLSSNHNSADYVFLSDVTSPQITGITVTSSQSITVKFSERLDPISAKNKNNFSISGNISIISATILPDSMSVKLKTTKQATDIEYTLTVSNIKDRSGNSQAPNPFLSLYRIPKRIKGNGTKNTISNVTAKSWDQNYTPDKTIDGLGMSNPESRWQSARIMPDTIAYDLSENVSMDSLRISFYKGDTGRLYKYSVYSSTDLNDWTPIVEDIWSEESEWTAIEFDSTNGRYMKLVLKESNQSNKASIWEFESFGAISKDNPNQNIVPAAFELSQNYPNPFNPSTKISWQSPVGSHQTLIIYDVLGNEVATLVDEYKPAGSYEVNFNAINLASGIYIYRLTADNYTETKKMVLLK
ncbi:MAG TPA: hypothetical protein DHV28_00835 [Ignavibacteriales bacterium]|nr:hypothetical protein [Ignavibacteriales bacterium]